ncbi:MAG: BamA/TamA family outer membrane protein [Oligoflexia bacterium]|nr:BamA/TamA family outer membrane protein [Oligoflexia bacterium]
MFISFFLLIISFLTINVTVNVTVVASDKYTVEGNTKTTTNHILFLIERCKRNNKGETTNELKQCLLNSRLFSSVAIDKNVIKVKERWTLIPIPELKFSNDNRSFGVFVIESNFLGMGKLLFVGGKFGSVERALFFFYKDRNLFYSEWTGDLSVSTGSRNLKTYQKKDELYAIKENAKNIHIRFGQNINHHFSLNLGIQHSNLSYQTMIPYVQPNDFSYFAAGPELTYNDSNYKLYFNEGHQIRINYIQQLQRSDNDKKSARIEYSWANQLNLTLDHVLQLRLSGFNIVNSNLRDSIKTGGSIGYRGVQSGGLWMKRSNNLSMDYLVPFLKAKYGTWIAAPFADYAIYDSYYNTDRNFFSYGIGSYLYLKEIAIPGVGLIVGINNKFLKNFVSFSMGMGM